MIAEQDLTAVAAIEEAAAKNTNSNTIAFAVGGAMLAIGAGLGYLLGNRKGVKKGEEAAKAALKEEIDILRGSVASVKETATS
jgi:AICAR transformylase/IMP cyclohydrolase PurH